MFFELMARASVYTGLPASRVLQIQSLHRIHGPGDVLIVSCSITHHVLLGLVLTPTWRMQ